MLDTSKIRINDLAREMEVKSKAILDVLTVVGVTEKKTHSSSITVEEAEKVRAHIKSGSASSAGTRAASRAHGDEFRTKIDLSHITRPGDVLKALQLKQHAAAAPPKPEAKPIAVPPAAKPAAKPAAPPVAAKPAAPPVAAKPAAPAEVPAPRFIKPPAEAPSRPVYKIPEAPRVAETSAPPVESAPEIRAEAADVEIVESEVPVLLPQKRPNPLCPSRLLFP
jgi:translation initiation factor IF-2